MQPHLMGLNQVVFKVVSLYPYDGKLSLLWPYLGAASFLYPVSLPSTQRSIPLYAQYTAIVAASQ